MEKPEIKTDNYMDSNGLLYMESEDMLASEPQHGEVSVLLSDEDWDDAELQAMHEAQTGV